MKAQCQEVLLLRRKSTNPIFSPEPPPKFEDHHQAGKIACGVGGGAVLRGVLDQLQLRQLDRLHDQW